MKRDFSQLLLGSDLRRLRENHRVVQIIHNQEDFDQLFKLVFHHERTLVMRAADAIEKVTLKNPAYLEPHKQQLLAILKSADHKELKWHIAQLISRVELNPGELNEVWHILSFWTLNVNESKIVRVNSLQALHDLVILHPDRERELMSIKSALKHERIPSIQARLRRLGN